MYSRIVVTEQAAFALIRAHVEKQFPKTCSKCACLFPTLKDYLRASTPRGTPVSYDADAGDWNPVSPIGTFSLSNCTCGTTLTLNSDGLSAWTLARLMLWARGQAKARGISFRELLGEIRNRLRSDILGEDEDITKTGP